jgi:anti-sigma B factor antagonist
VIDALGDLDYASAAWFRRQMDRAGEPSWPRGLILNLEHVAFCDSSGLSELIALLRRCQGNDGHLILAGPNQAMIRILTITGLIGAFHVVADTTAAMSALLPQSHHR